MMSDPPMRKCIQFEEEWKNGDMLGHGLIDSTR